jgi:hypothetical protein
MTVAGWGARTGGAIMKIILGELIMFSCVMGIVLSVANLLG